MAACPSCDRDLSFSGQPGHVCYTYAEHAAKQLAKQGDGDLPRTYAPAATRVSDPLAGATVHLSRHTEDVVVIGRHAVFLPQHSLEAEAAMSAELVACTLGQRVRPELLPDVFSGVLAGA